MDIPKLIQELCEERQRLEQAIAALERLDTTPQLTLVPEKPKGMSPAVRKRLSVAMKKRWAQRKAA